MADLNAFSVRIVSIDYYMAPPIPDLDICYSSFQGGKVNEVPVVRIYGSTPAGQKTCLHIHRALPYFYVPCTDISVHPQDEDDTYRRVICLAIEKALKLQSRAGSKRQHVHGCGLVRARKLYGFHSSEELFVKIYLYYPHDVSRAASLLLGGAVLNKSLQPHESHIPFLLQFMIDHNLYGMGLLHISKMKFRHPVPDHFALRKAHNGGKPGEDMMKFPFLSTDNQAVSSGDVYPCSPVWISSTIPGDWLWQSSCDLDESDQIIPLVKRRSTCDLEVDSSVDEILNQQFQMYSSFSQARTDVKMVQSLIPIWEEEYERTGIYEAAIPPDTEKPLPGDVLKILSHGLGYEDKLWELGAIEETSSTPFEKDEKLVHSIGTLTGLGTPVEHGGVKSCANDGEPSEYFYAKNRLESLLSQGTLFEENHSTVQGERDSKLLDGLPSDLIGTSAPKGADQEALGLLKWLASSQAAEDVNSDDELACEMILSPLLPATTIGKVLEKASKDYESESQQECQDILDSVDLIDFEKLKEKPFSVKHSISLDKVVPQLDGSGDDQYRADSTDLCEKEVNGESERPSQCQLQQDASISFSSKHKRKRPLWDSLQFSMSQKVDDVVLPVNFNLASVSGTKVGSGEKETVKCSDVSLNNVETDFCDLKKASSLVGCSVRDLMRKKRCQRLDPPECKTQKVEKILFEGDKKEDKFICPEQFEFGTTRACLATDMCPLESPILRHPFPDHQTEIFDRTPCLETSGLKAHALKDGHVRLSGRLGAEAGTGTTAGLGNTSGSYPLHSRIRKLPLLSYPGNQESAVLEPHCENHNHDESLAAVSMEPEISDVNVQLLDTDDKHLGDGPHQMNVADLSCSSACPVKEMSGKDRDELRNAENNSSFNYAPVMSFTNLRGKATVGSTVLQYERCENGQQGRDNCLYISGRSASKAVDSTGECPEFVCMTFCEKPPKIQWADGTSEAASRLPAIESCPLPGNRNGFEGTSVQGQGADEYLPFFVDQEDGELQNACHKNRDFNSHHGVTGVPLHYQNDGSLFYLLTPVFSPPTGDCVSRWLLHNDMGILRENSGTEEKGFSRAPMTSHGCHADACTRLLTGFHSDTHVNPVPNLPDCEKGLAVSTEMKNFCDDLAPALHDKENYLKLKNYSDSAQDFSQISGPAGKLKPTPDSQMGFRDPASVGGGQQLTLLSVEVLAECRGDLRPDPRFDAINVIALAFQEDNDCALDVFILLCGNTGSYSRCLDGISGCKICFHSEEKQLLEHFVKIVRSFDPDILLGWDIQGASLGFLAERASHFSIGLVNNISRTPSEIRTAAGSSEISNKAFQDNMLPESVFSESVLTEDAIIEDEWGRTHASGIHVGGRVVLNVWRLMRSELKLNLYTVEAVAESVLRRKVPFISNRVLTTWYSSGPGKARYRCIEYVIDRAKLNLDIVNQLDLINRTSELARVFGIDFFSVLSRGSQYRVESMLLRLAHTQNYLAISPGNQQVASQPAMECLPLVMEPESGFYADPVVVLDFQSLYPSMVIAYNLCFCTCLGKVQPSMENTLGVSSFSPDMTVLRDLKQQLLLTPNGVMYVPSKVRKGILPRLLEEILSTRIMVKQAMKKLAPSQQVLQRIFNARQLALKLIANVTYGYTAAGFSGRMPCAELADSIVQTGRRTLENAISVVNGHDKWKARVIYGDTDSMFVLLKGRTTKESFKIGQEIASAITAMNPDPVTLKFEKVYHPCFLLTKKRYVGYSYEKPDQIEPIFDAKGIETVRRDTCGAVSKTMEQSLRLFFEHQDLLKVKLYLQRQWTRILSGRVSLQDFVFAKEVRLGTYSTRDSSLLPPAAIVATKAMKTDPRAEPRYAERIPYVVIHGSPGARLVDMVVDPLDLLAIDSPFRLNDLYYIKKQIIPALQRVFGLVLGDLSQWFSELPRLVRESSAKRHLYAPYSHRTRIDYYYLSKHCIICGELAHKAAQLCDKCSSRGVAVATAVTGRTSKLEREMQHLAAICRHCGGGDWVMESGVKCTSLACSVFFERRKVQKELQALSAVATDAGFYPECMIEWF